MDIAFAGMTLPVLDTIISTFADTFRARSMRLTESHAEQIWRSRATQSHADYREIFIPLSGNTRMKLAGQLYLCKPGVAMLVDRREQHDLGYAPDNEDARHIWIFLFSDTAQINCDTSINGTYTVFFSQMISSQNLIRALNDEWNAAVTGKFSPEVSEFRILSILSVMLSELHGRNPENDSMLPDRYRIIKSIVHHIEYYSGRFSDAVTLAKMSGYSRSHFQKLFREYSGRSVSECIATARIKKYQTLKSSGTPMKIIAQELGFASTSAMDHWLRDTMKNLPGIEK